MFPRPRTRARGGYGRGSNPFSPTDIPNLALWLDASDTSTITQVAGLVSQWADKSGNGYHAGQATGANQPTTGTNTINSLNAVYFNTNKMMNFPSSIYTLPSGDLTIFLVGKKNSAVLSTFLNLGSSGGGGRRTGALGASNWEGNHGAFNVFSSVSADTSPVILTIRDELPSSVRLYKNGATSSGSAVARTLYTADQGSIGMFPGGFAPLDGLIAEQIIYSRVLSNSETNQVGNYLSAKWGISWSNL